MDRVGLLNMSFVRYELIYLTYQRCFHVNIVSEEAHLSSCRARFMFVAASCAPYSEPRCIADIGVASATAAALRDPT